MTVLHHFSRRLGLGAGLFAGMLALGACDQELPTEVGGEHVPEAALRTYEVLLPDSAFLLSDSILRGFGTSAQAPLLMVAQDWLDTLDAHALVRFGDFPSVLAYIDSTGTQTDTVDRYVGGRFVVRVDTAALGLDTLATDTTIALEAYAIAESFDPRTASWRARRVDAGDSTFWTTPGGTTGALLGSGTWTRGDTINGDSVVFNVDSATIAQWAQAEEDARGVLIRTTTAGARVQVVVPRLTLTARTLEDPDSTRSANAIVSGQTFVADPAEPAPTDELRVGGRSAWRSFLTFRPGLDTVTIACPDEPDCTFRLGDVTVNRAEMWLSPLPVDSVHRPLGSFGLEARPIIGAESLPLERTPVGDTTGVAFALTAARFDGVDDDPVRIGVTRFLRGLLNAATDTAVTDRQRTLVLMSIPEPVAYGIARFGDVDAGAAAPLLRLVVTVPPREEQD